jgi:hypothetical protein
MVTELLMGLGRLVFRISKFFWHKYKVPKLEIISLDHQVVPLPASSPAPGALYALKRSPMTASETYFLSVLDRVVDGHYKIIPQVGLSALVRTAAESERAYADFNRIKAKSVDYVLYDEKYRPYLAIELDDPSHRRWDRMMRDLFVNNVMQSVGLRILHVERRESYDEEWLKEQIFLQPLSSQVPPVVTAPISQAQESKGWVRK